MLVGGGEGMDVGQETSSGDLGLDLKDRGYEQLLWNWTTRGYFQAMGRKKMDGKVAVVVFRSLQTRA